MDEQQLNQKGLKSRWGLVRFYRLKYSIKMWRKLAKKSQHRLNVLKEWAQTEQNYMNDLKFIIERIQGPMVAQGLISEAQKSILFSNVDVIAILSQNLLDQLKEVLRNWNPNKVVISTRLNRLHSFFRIYIEYCTVFCKGQNILKELKGQPSFRDLEKTLPMDVASYLIKPVQRPPKYMLLLRDYQKHMPHNHIDYADISKTISNYHKVNEINNQSIAKESRAEKTFYLERLSGGTLLSSAREFIGEYQGLVGDESVVLYVFTDLVMICNNLDTKQMISKMIYLNGASYVQIVPDGKYFQNYLFLCGKSECIHLNFYNRDGLNTVYDILTNRIDSEFQKEDQRRSIIANNNLKPVKVRVTLAQNKMETFSRSVQFRIVVKGAEKRPLSSIKNDTIYIVKFHIHRPWPLGQYLFLRFSVVEEIEAYIRKKHPSLDLPRLKPMDMGSYDQTKNSTRIIEFRCMAITQFLNVVFRNETPMSNPLLLIQKLKIDENFWSFAVEDDKVNCFCEMCSRKEPFSVEEFFRQKFQYLKGFKQLPKEKYCMKKYANDTLKLLKNTNISVIDSLTRIFAWINAFQGRIDYCKIFKKKKSSSISIKVWFANIADEFMQFKIEPQATVGDVLTMIAKEFNIHCIDDFGLFLDYSGLPRLLDPDENICEVMLQVEADVEEMAGDGLLDKLQKWGTDIFHGKKSKIYLRKYLFIEKQMQKNACKANLERYRMVVEQIFYDVKHNVIALSKEQLVEMSAYFVILKSLARLPFIKKTNFPADTLRLLLSGSKESLLDSSKWVDAVCELIAWDKEQILGAPNQLAFLYEKILRIVEAKESYRCMWFKVNNYYPESIQGSLKQVMIATNYESFMVLDPRTHEVKVCIPLLELKYRTTVYSFFVDVTEVKYRFDGRMLQNLSRIIEKYKIYNRLFSNIEARHSK